MYKMDQFPPITEEQRQRLITGRKAPVFGLLGMRVDNVEAGHSWLSLPFRDELTHAGGFVQGGIITALADAAVAFAVWSVIDGTHQDQTSIDLKMNFIRPAAGDMRAEGWLIHLGGRTAVGESVVLNGQDKPIAKCLSSVMIVERAYMPKYQER